MNPFFSKAVGKRVVLDPTPQQEIFWDEATGNSDASILVEARAGAGKSTSAREAMRRQLEAHPSLRICYTVFSRDNATEFKNDCPDGVNVNTLHGFGLRALGRSYRTKVERDKTYMALDETEVGKKMPKYIRKSVSLLVGYAKNHMLRPGQPGLDVILRNLMLHYEVKPYGKREDIVGLASLVLKRSAEWVELCDFDDMIWLPCIHNISFDHCDSLYIDESQDLNFAQHELVRLICPYGRMMVIGDRHQAIYAFRGADSQSIPNLEAMLKSRPDGLRQTPLTVSMRCPREHIALAQKIVSDIEAHPKAIDGEVYDYELDGAVAEFTHGDMVLCPHNAPLITGALRLIAQGRTARVRGRKIGDSLLDIYRPLSGAGGGRTMAEIIRDVDAWKYDQISKLSELNDASDLIESIQDRAAGLRAVLSSCRQPSEVEPAIYRLFTDDAPDSERGVTFSTVHRAKGLEADRVWLLESPQRPPSVDWEAQQQANLRYVALTRSKNFLAFVSLEKNRGN